jgi:toxin-antitoxin system PIN domain toxin
MIVPDVNLLVFAYNAAAPDHESARQWWEDLLSGDRPVALPWAVVMGFLRLTTHPAVLATPLAPGAAMERIEAWFDQPCVQALDPGPRHLNIVGTLIEATGVAGRLTTDIHIAAIAMEHQCELHSGDSDFARFAGLRWHNPLASR